MAKRRLVLVFEFVDEGQGLLSFSRPQDFRVKAARWVYSKIQAFIDGDEWEVFIYGRRWKGDGSKLEQLQQADQPTPSELYNDAWKYRLEMGGWPYGDQDLPMSPDDPLDEDDMLDPSDNPDDFKYYDEDEDEDGDEE